MSSVAITSFLMGDGELESQTGYSCVGLLRAHFADTLTSLPAPGLGRTGSSMLHHMLALSSPPLSVSLMPTVRRSDHPPGGFQNPPVLPPPRRPRPRCHIFSIRTLKCYSHGVVRGVRGAAGLFRKSQQ
jgi:hypothetical protein